MEASRDIPAPEQRADYAPEGTTATGTGTVATLKRTIAEFKDDELLDRAAALTFFALLSLFPALLVMVALLGIFGQYPQTIDSMAEILTGAGVARDTVDSIRTPVDDRRAQRRWCRRAAGDRPRGCDLVGGGLRRRLQARLERRLRGRGGPPLLEAAPAADRADDRRRAVDLADRLLHRADRRGARSAGDVLGIGDATVTAWNIVKWPVLLIVASLIVAVLFWATPNVKQQFHLISPGSVLALVIWIVATLAFSLYLSTIGSYSKTYGTLGGLIALLVWLWLSNIALLFGTELNSEVERSRQLRAGLPAQERLQLEPRAAPRPQRTT